MQPGQISKPSLKGLSPPGAFGVWSCPGNASSALDACQPLRLAHFDVPDLEACLSVLRDLLAKSQGIWQIQVLQRQGSTAFVCQSCVGGNKMLPAFAWQLNHTQPTTWHGPRPALGQLQGQPQTTCNCDISNCRYDWLQEFTFADEFGCGHGCDQHHFLTVTCASIQGHPHMLPDV